MMKHIYKIMLVLVLCVCNADAMLSRAVRAYASFGKSLAKRLPLRAQAGTVAAGTGLTAYSFWPFSKKKQTDVQTEAEVEEAIAYEYGDDTTSRAESITLDTANVDVTYSHNGKEPIQFPASIIGHLPDKYRDVYRDDRLYEKERVAGGFIWGWYETGGQRLSCVFRPVGLAREWSDQQFTSADFLGLPREWDKVLDWGRTIHFGPFSRAPKVEVSWGRWEPKEHQSIPDVPQFIPEKPTTTIHLPHTILGKDHRTEIVQCIFLKIRKDNKPGIKANCGNISVSAVSATQNPLHYTINGYSAALALAKKGVHGVIAASDLNSD